MTDGMISGCFGAGSLSYILQLLSLLSCQRKILVTITRVNVEGSQLGYFEINNLRYYT